MDWTQVAIAVASLLFSAVLMPLSKALWSWLKSRARSETLLAALTEAQTVADNVVAGLQQSVVDGLKAKSADGKLSAEEARQVAKTALDLFWSNLSSQSLAVLTENADDIGAYVSNLLEARLLKLKGGK